MPTKPRVHNPIHPALRAKLEAQKAADRERRRKEYEKGEQRTEDRAFYSSKRWMRFRAYLLTKTEFSLCAECLKQGRVTPTNQIDHIKPRKEYPELAWDESNLQGLCREHHRSKTARGE